MLSVSLTGFVKSTPLVDHVRNRLPLASLRMSVETFELAVTVALASVIV